MNYSLIIFMLFWNLNKCFVPRDFELNKTSKLFQNGKLYTGYSMIFGNNTSGINLNSTFFLDFGFESIMIGWKEKINKGVDCNEFNKCKVLSKKRKEIFYASKHYYVYNAKARISFPQLTPKSPNMLREPFDKNGADVKLIASGNEWSFQNWGIIGLLPYGTFSQYFRTFYSDNVSLLIGYTDLEVEGNKYLSEKLIINPSYTSNAVAGSFPLEVGDQFWTLKGSMDTQQPLFDFQDQKICLTNADDNILICPYYKDHCNAIKKIICKVDNLMDCTKDKADFKMAPELKFTIQEHVFSFSPSEYLYEDQNKRIACRFGFNFITTERQACHPDAVYAFGKTFMKKYMTVLEFKKEKIPKITFLTKYSKPKSIFDIDLVDLILTLTGLALVVFFVWFLLKKKQISDERNYPDYMEVKNE